LQAPSFHTETFEPEDLEPVKKKKEKKEPKPKAEPAMKQVRG